VRIARGSSVGSGVVVGNDGLIVTNAHVVKDTGPVTVTFPNSLAVVGEVVKIDEALDLAAVHVPLTAGNVGRLSDSSPMKVGDTVFVVGFALNLPGDPTVTRGIFSGRRQLTGEPDLLQTDAAMNPGVSGGALLNSAGGVVGINVAGIERSGDRPVQGVNFAIPSEVVRPFVEAASRQLPSAVPKAQPVPPRLDFAGMMVQQGEIAGFLALNEIVNVRCWPFDSGVEPVDKKVAPDKECQGIHREYQLDLHGGQTDAGLRVSPIVYEYRTPTEASEWFNTYSTNRSTELSFEVEVPTVGPDGSRTKIWKLPRYANDVSFVHTVVRAAKSRFQIGVATDGDGFLCGTSSIRGCVDRSALSSEPLRVAGVVSRLLYSRLPSS